MTQKEQPPPLAGDRGKDETFAENSSTERTFIEELTGMVLDGHSRWFECNPDRSHHPREPFTDEVDPEAGYPYVYVVVRQQSVMYGVVPEQLEIIAEAADLAAAFSQGAVQ